MIAKYSRKSRSTCLITQKNGLIEKAEKLRKLCQVNVAVIIFDPASEKYYTYRSEGMVSCASIYLCCTDLFRISLFAARRAPFEQFHSGPNIYCEERAECVSGNQNERPCLRSLPASLEHQLPCYLIHARPKHPLLGIRDSIPWRGKREFLIRSRH